MKKKRKSKGKEVRWKKEKGSNKEMTKKRKSKGKDLSELARLFLWAEGERRML